ncbi:MAG: hypothetical protein ACI9FR_002867 [Cryomorphaceae bacterium]|jgi:hypothetical protein
MENAGFIFGVFGFVLGALAIQRIAVLEKKLKETGVLDKDFDTEKEIEK